MVALRLAAIERIGVVPLVEAGAFLLKADEGPNWQNYSTFMLIFTTVRAHQLVAFCDSDANKDRLRV